MSNRLSGNEVKVLVADAPPSGETPLQDLPEQL
jgi:hypothetical protein